MTGDALERYRQKLNIINGQDPYEIDMKDMFDAQHYASHLPEVQYPDSVNYSVFTKSAYTMEEFKCYQSLESFNQFHSGWVSDVSSKEVNGKIVLRAKVCNLHCFLCLLILTVFTCLFSLKNSKWKCQ